MDSVLHGILMELWLLEGVPICSVPSCRTTWGWLDLDCMRPPCFFYLLSLITCKLQIQHWPRTTTPWSMGVWWATIQKVAFFHATKRIHWIHSRFMMQRAATLEPKPSPVLVPILCVVSSGVSVTNVTKNTLKVVALWPAPSGQSHCWPKRWRPRCCWRR